MQVKIKQSAYMGSEKSDIIVTSQTLQLKEIIYLSRLMISLAKMSIIQAYQKVT